MSFLPLAYSQLVGSIGFFFQDCCLNGLEIPAISFAQSLSSRGDSLPRESTPEVNVPLLKKRLIAVSWSLFSKFASTELGAIHYGHIAEYDSVKNEKNLLGSRMPCSTEHSDFDSAEPNVNDGTITVRRHY